MKRYAFVVGFAALVAAGMLIQTTGLRRGTVAFRARAGCGEGLRATRRARQVLRVPCPAAERVGVCRRHSVDEAHPRDPGVRTARGLRVRDA
jgi:hypothetical protein